MEATREIQVRMCELHGGSGQDILRATLGSCVGIGLLWRQQGRYALAHCLLPEAPANAAAFGAKYVSDAVPSLLSLLEVPASRIDQLEAVLAGGACMVTHATPPRHGLIGEQNARAAQRLLAAAGIRVVHQEVGGECGRQLLIDCARHQYHVRTIERHT
ncbi:chemotaxis protein CheD [Dyella sp. C9]|uniref:chemotaxis protein CheD n=1 Tax=Dyella sp. C9 TaxID=2202154 RepID=UPI000DF00053|nr:chemotaxis protein CheD [Dyella sp. C9]